VEKTHSPVRVVQKVLHRVILLRHDLGKDLCEARDGREVVGLQRREFPEGRRASIGLDGISFDRIEGI
jgi:hypothetical protein